MAPLVGISTITILAGIRDVHSLIQSSPVLHVSNGQLNHFTCYRVLTKDLTFAGLTILLPSCPESTERKERSIRHFLAEILTDLNYNEMSDEEDLLTFVNQSSAAVTATDCSIRLLR